MPTDVLYNEELQRLYRLLEEQRKMYESLKQKIRIERLKQFVENLFRKAEMDLIKAEREPMVLLEVAKKTIEEDLKNAIKRIGKSLEEKKMQEMKETAKVDINELVAIRESLIRRDKHKDKPYLIDNINKLAENYMNFLKRLDYEDSGEENPQDLPYKTELFSLFSQKKAVQREVDSLLRKRRRRIFGGDILQYDLVCFIVVVIATLIIIWLFVGDDSPLSAKENAMSGGVFRLLLSQ